jgi:biotin carboxylase
MKSPRLLLLSTTTGYQLRSFNEAAERLGIELVFATDRCHQLDDPWRDRALAIRFHEPHESLEIIVREARRRPFNGIVVVGDRPAVLAALVAERLGLSGHAPDAAAASVNKRESRLRFAAAGLAVPWHFTTDIGRDPHDVAGDRRVRFPCVLKPLALSGSRGVIRADSPAGFVAAFARLRALLARVDVRAARTGLEDVVLIEGFIPGREFALEGVLTRGALQVFAIFDKPDPLDGPFFEETVYVTPSSLDPPAQQRLVTAVQRAAAALGLWHGPVHAECRIAAEDVVVLEVAARPIGGLCSRALRFENGASLEEVLLRHALGEDVSGCRRDPSASAVMMIPILRRGLLKRIEGEQAARAVAGIEEIRITARPDQLLEPLPEAGSYLGFVFAQAERASEAEAAVREAHRRLRFVIKKEIAVESQRAQ